MRKASAIPPSRSRASSIPAASGSSDKFLTGVVFNDLFRRAAGFVDKILKGARPADLPVEQPTKFELVINRGAAKRIGLAIPADVLARADRIVD